MKRIFPNSTYSALGGQRRIDLETWVTLEDLLWGSLPQIEFFGTEYNLLEDLPDQITAKDLAAPGQLRAAFIDYLGDNDVRRLLRSDSVVERDRLIAKFDAKLVCLADEVNEHGDPGATKPLFGIRVGMHQARGMKVFPLTNGIDLFFRLISPNTKMLFAYYLYRERDRIKDPAQRSMANAILLFDEPNNGFHASAQASLLRFLKSLAQEGNLVVVATHSEHLIDPTHLSGVRLMSQDAERSRLHITNHYFSQRSGKGTGDMLALRPILDAIGLHYGEPGLLSRDKVVITEGITDMLYLQAFIALCRLRRRAELSRPHGGVSQIPIWYRSSSRRG